MRPRPQIPPDIEEYRDERWRREGMRQVETAFEAERFIEQVGFAFCLTDSRRPGPSLYVAVCGRRDEVMPRNVQKDLEASLTWVLKDELLKRGKVYYAKLWRGKAMFLAPRMVPYFHAIWGVRRSEEKRRLSRHARAILRVLRREWEMSTADLRDESGVKDRKADGATVAAKRSSRTRLHCAEETHMDLPIAWLIGAGLFLLILAPFLYFQIQRGKARGHTWFTWWKPRGHSDIGPDTGPRPTAPGGVDQGRGARY